MHIRISTNSLFSFLPNPIAIILPAWCLAHFWNPRAHLVVRDEDLSLPLTQIEGTDVKQNSGTFLIPQCVPVIQTNLQNILSERTKTLAACKALRFYFYYIKSCFVWHAVLFVLNSAQHKGSKQVSVCVTGNVMLCDFDSCEVLHLMNKLYKPLNRSWEIKIKAAGFVKPWACDWGVYWREMQQGVLL